MTSPATGRTDSPAAAQAPETGDHLPPRREPAATPRGAFSVRPMRLGSSDLTVLREWMNVPAVARFWSLAGPEVRLDTHLHQLFAGSHSRPYVGLLDGVPMSYWELYWAAQDPLAEHYAARPGDAGMHLLLGPARFRGGGLGRHLIRAVSDWQLAHPRARRVVAEPDVENVASVRAFEQAGFVRTEDVALPDKTAALMVRDR
jgi:acetyl CoA:N6-hydroxylysine acetyl transferase